MQLVIDIGNTAVKAGLFDKRMLIASTSFQEDAADALEEMLATHPVPSRAILSTVGRTENNLTDWLSNKGCRVLTFTHETSLPLTNMYQTPETLGLDRLAAAVGAFSIYPGQDMLVIDAGSALTFDLVTQQGEYLGGNISPGLTMRYRALHEFTARLPLLSPNPVFPLVGYDTQSAMVAGIQNGILFETDGIIAALTQQYQGLKVILTGGDADFFAGNLKNPIFVVANLVLIGLNHILLYNEEDR